MNWVNLPGSAWLGWLKNHPLRIGVLTGVYLTTIMAVALIVANRVPTLEGFAEIRNMACYALFGIVAMVPACSFLRRPWHLFTSGLTAWFLFTTAYAGAGQIFIHLFTRKLYPFNIFMIGAMSYGLMAVVVWLVHLIAAMRSPVAAQQHGRIYHKAE
jgi:hypothetical protein